MSPDYYYCENCNEVIHHDECVGDLENSCLEGSCKLTVDETNLFNSIKWCHHILCVDCSPIKVKYSGDIDDYFNEIIEKIRKDSDYIKIFEKDIKCELCKKKKKDKIIKKIYGGKKTIKEL